MDGNSLNIPQDLIERLKELIPQAFSEDKLDFQRLQTLLGESIHTENERYQLSWAGKSEAYKVLQMPTTATLIPQPEQSVNWEEAENIFIEGENLEVLKVLQKSYYGKIKMIYIDPPYNTGSDSFIYPDKFSESKEEYLKRIGEKDEEGYMMKEGLFRKNSKENGQFHSNWLNMMLPRLFLARNLLKDDGMIFVSIDDNEQPNLKLLMDEIFGEENYLTTLAIKVRYEGKTLVEDMDFQKLVEYVIIYSKNSNRVALKKQELDYSLDKFEWYIEENGKPKEIILGGKKVHIFTKDKYSLIKKEPGVNGLKEIWASGKILDGNSSGRFFRDYLAGRKDEDGLDVLYKVDGIGDDELPYRYFTGPKKSNATKGKYFQGVPSSILGNIEETKKELPIVNFYDLADSFGNCRHEGNIDFRNGKKPLALLKILLEMVKLEDEDIILDFFAGSGTTAHAVIESNEKLETSYKYICVQLPENIDPNSEAYKLGFKFISEITEGRIKNVISAIKEKRNGKIEFSKSQNLGFRKFTLQASNFKIWRSDVIENEEELSKQMELFVTPQRANAQTENILWELLIKNGISLSEKIELIELSEDANIYHTSDKRIAFVLDKYTSEVQAKVLELSPRMVICLDSLFQNEDSVKTNAQLKLEDNGITFKTV